LVHIFDNKKANAIGGRNEKAVQEFLEKQWNNTLSQEQTIRLTIKALLEVVDSGSKNMEVCVMVNGELMRLLAEENLEAIIKDIEKEQEDAKAKKTAQEGENVEG
jgi:20S proteasome subunit alpha 4